MPDVQAPRPFASWRVLRWLAGFALGGMAGPLVLYAVLRGLQPASILEVTIVTDANEPVRLAEASFAGWPLTVEYAADGALRFHHEHTQRRAGELRLAVDVDGVRHETVLRLGLTPRPDPEGSNKFKLWEAVRIPQAVPICHVVARVAPNALVVSNCLEPFQY
jgi:hypothetical protein